MARIGRYDSRALGSAVALLAALALAAAGCGGGGGGGEDSEPEASYEITAMEFITALAPEKMKILRDYVASEPNDCPEVDEGLLISASIDATEVPADAPFEEVMADTCGK